MGSSKTAPMSAPFCADCRGKDERDCRKCERIPLGSQKSNKKPEAKGKSIFFKDGKYHYSHDGD